MFFKWISSTCVSVVTQIEAFPYLCWKQLNICQFKNKNVNKCNYKSLLSITFLCIAFMPAKHFKILALHLTFCTASQLFQKQGGKINIQEDALRAECLLFCHLVRVNVQSLQTGSTVILLP